MQQLNQILTAIDTDLDLVMLVGDRCMSQAAQAGDGYDRLGVVPFSSGAELRILKAGRVLLRMGGPDFLIRAFDTIMEQTMVIDGGARFCDAYGTSRRKCRHSGRRKRGSTWNVTTN